MDDIRERVAAIEAKMEAHHENTMAMLTRLDHHLLGNGQPGVLDKHDNRITALEHGQIRFAGVVTGLSLAAGAVSDTVRHWFTKGH